MEDDDDLDHFDLENELERELEAGMEVDEEDDEALTVCLRADASAEGPSETQPSGRGPADEQPSTSAATAAQPGGSTEIMQLDEQQQLKARKQQQQQRKNKDVMKLLTEDQLDRYEAFRRSKLSRANMRKLLHNVTGQAPHLNTTIVMCGLAKLFVGDMVETARMVAAEMGDPGALTPTHLQEAFQRLDRQGKVPHRAKKPRRMHIL